LKLVKDTAIAKFDEAVDIAVNLGIDAKKSDQTVRGSVVLPAGIGKKVRVAVFTQGDKAKAAKEAGADIVGFDDLAAKIKEGFMDFDVVIATPDAMKVVGALGQILGPRGLMPNPKVGTVSPDVVTAVKTQRPARSSTAPTRRDRSVHDRRASFTRSSSRTNLMALIDASTSEAEGHQGRVPEKISVSSTMGAGVRWIRGPVATSTDALMDRRKFRSLRSHDTFGEFRSARKARGGPVAFSRSKARKDEDFEGTPEAMRRPACRQRP